MTYAPDQLLSMYCDLNEAQKTDFLTLIQNGARISDGAIAIPEFGAEDAGRILTVITEDAPQPETQNVSINATPTGGTWTLAYPGADPIIDLAFDITPGDLQTALQDGYENSGILVGGTGDVFLDSEENSFIGLLGGENIDLFVADGSGLTGPDSPYVLTFEETKPGIPGVYSPGWAPINLNIATDEVIDLTSNDSIELEVSDEAADNATLMLLNNALAGSIRLVANGEDGFILLSPSDGNISLVTSGAGNGIDIDASDSDGVLLGGKLGFNVNPISPPVVPAGSNVAAVLAGLHALGLFVEA